MEEIVRTKKNQTKKNEQQSEITKKPRIKKQVTTTTENIQPEHPVTTTENSNIRPSGPCCSECLYPTQSLWAHKCPLCKVPIHPLCAEQWGIPIYQDTEYLCKKCHLLKEDNNKDAGTITKSTVGNKVTERVVTIGSNSNTVAHMAINADNKSFINLENEYDSDKCRQDHKFLNEECNRQWWQTNKLEICGDCEKMLNGKKYYFCENTSCNFKKCDSCYLEGLKNDGGKRAARDKRKNSRFNDL